MDDLCDLLDRYKKYHNLIKDKNLAEHLKLSNAYLCDIRKGRRRLSDKLIIQMSSTLGLDCGQFLIAARVAYSDQAEEKLAWKRVLKKHTHVELHQELEPVSDIYEPSMTPELELV
jgi:plasmid maintenance system antidote protein VapI